MATTVCLLSSRVIDHRLRLLNPYSSAFRSPSSRNHNAKCISKFASAGPRTVAINSADVVGPHSVPFFSFFPLFLSTLCNDISKNCADKFAPDSEKGFHLWDPVGDKLAIPNGCGEKREIWTVVLLGWLGAEKKHLKRYADIYNSKGIRSVRFVVPMWELVGLDFGRRMEKKVEMFVAELVDWCSESEKDARERHLLFHAFSNTGWLVYGLILQKLLQTRKDIIEKIKGCVIDSAPAPEISPEVWAAGFCTALMKRRSSAVHYASLEPPINGRNATDRSNGQDYELHTLEIISIFILKKIFSIILFLPDINQRLGKVISIMTKQQPRCPQLYLYSSADRVIPASSVESFFQEQRASGRGNVQSYNFGTSPHVDHFRSFPQIYTAKISEFLEVCRSEIICGKI